MVLGMLDVKYGTRLQLVMLRVAQATQIFGSRKYGSAEVSWNWLQLMCCTYLQSRPGYFEQRL